jgi:hypothetical protein
MKLTHIGNITQNTYDKMANLRILGMRGIGVKGEFISFGHSDY